jgi:hypothetical protein
MNDPGLLYSLMTVLKSLINIICNLYPILVTQSDIYTWQQITGTKYPVTSKA